MTDAELDQLRGDSALLRSIISQQVTLKREGKYWKGCCPFHDDSNPSFTVYDNGFHCFACGARGSVFDYVMKAERIDFAAACRRVATEAGIATSTPKHKGNGMHKGDVWQPIAPPPPNAPLPSTDQLHADMLHEYCAPDDRLLCYVRRHEAKNGKRKQFYPLTYGTLNDKPGWYDRAPAAPRPLYGLNRLSHATPDVAALLCEGEKAADAAQRLFPDMACMTWMGGANADAAADFSPLAGHSVILWPDADQPGRDVMARIAQRLPLARILDTAGLADGFDAADLEQGCEDPQAWLKARLREPPNEAAPDADLLAALAVQAWCDLPLPPLRRLLGDVVTEAARVFLVGATGIGKTLFAYAIAAGQRFLHWSCDGPVRVLVIDGEMSPRMIKKRAQLILQHQAHVPPGNLLIYSLQRADEFARRFPQLGQPAPLNRDEGRDWLLRMIALVQPDVVILDNVMSLIAGVMKEEEPWQQTLPLVLGITALGKAQIWLDHTGWNSDRQYGTSTKGWFFDAIGVLLRPPEDEKAAERETCFDLSFEAPSGKARNRDPDRWTDFAPHRIRLTDSGWSYELIERDNRGKGKGKGKVEPAVLLFHDALMDALAISSTKPGETTMPAWEGECLRRDLIEPFVKEDDHKDRSNKRAKFRKAKSDLQAAKMVAISGNHVRDLTRRW
jgi:hypothetical protein